ncbi:MAG: glycosyltransferase family 39 protein [Bacteroidetes bacterium]|nr:glycosyltransferase family 39 protein [Bacteroidota bacterium]
MSIADNINKSSRAKYIFLGIWLVLGLLQSYFTELFHDESYWWVHSKFLAWGYFDHPPMIAIMVKIGYLFFQNELGVRLMMVILSVATLFLVEKMTSGKDLALFIAIAISISLVHVGNFMAVPDIPLLFFSTLFLFIYRDYLRSDGIRNTILLSLAIVFVLYSKYHGILLIFFTLLSNLALLKKRSFWIVALLSTALFIPHLYWQYANDFVTIRFHLLDRSREAYSLLLTADYIGGQLLLTGPVIGFLLLYAAFFQKPEDKFERALKFVTIGIFSFFLVSTLKGHVEANWTAVAFIPMIILAHKFISRRMNFRKWIFYLTPLSLVLIFTLRFFLAYDFLPENRKFKTQFHKWDDWALDIKDHANGAFVIFGNSYEDASKYWFYTGEQAYCLNNIMYPGNQYDIWNFEEGIQGKRVMYMHNWKSSNYDSFQTVHDKTIYYWIVDDFRSYNRVYIEMENRLRLPADTTISIPITLSNNFSYPIYFNENPDIKTYLSFHFFKNKKRVEYGRIYPELNGTPLIDSLEMNVMVNTPENPGKYVLRIGITAGRFPAGRNSIFKTVTIY